MENDDSLQSRGSLDEKARLEQPENEEKQQDVEIFPPKDEETSTANETASKEPEWEYITGLKLILVLIAITLACFLMLLDNSIIATASEAILSLHSVYLHTRQAIPRITNDFKSLDDIGWYGSAYLIAK